MTVSVLVDFCAATPQGRRQRWSATHPLQVLVARKPDEVEPLINAAWEQSLIGKHVVMFVKYEAASAFDEVFVVKESSAPLAWAAVFGSVTEGWSTSSADKTYEPMHWSSAQTRSQFDANIGAIHAAIEAGETYQINYTDAVESPFEGDARALFAALHRAQPESYSAFIDTGDEQILSVSPELFFDWHEGNILSRPMKGTATRGTTPESDRAQAAHLKESVKERAENLMIVDLIRNDLSRIAQPFSVKVPRLFETQAWPTVWQMTSDVIAQTKEGTTLADVFRALFPCGSVTGVPKVRAMQIIDRIEPSPRGVYCGAIGVLSPGGAATFNVAIRTVTVQNKIAHCGIGSGITIDATAAGEWQEWLNKRAFLERAASKFDLLQTLRLSNGLFSDGELHLERMARAAVNFGFEWHKSNAVETLERVAASHPTGDWRVRLLARADGEITAQTFAFSPDPPASAIVQVARQALVNTTSEFVMHKTTRRDHYDAFAPGSIGVFDTLLFNERLEVTEFTRGNVAMKIGGEWVTPPLGCGLLDGVGRALALKSGRVKEKAVLVDDLVRVEEFAFVNALRGWIPVSLSDQATSG